MVLLKCTECKQEVSEKDKKCPKCGEIVITHRDWVVAIGLLAVFFICGCLIFAAIFPAKTSSSNNTPSPPSEIEICVSADDLVKLLLKSPATAKFPFCGDQQVVNVGADKWQVSSYVDSQNGFGAFLRTYFTVVVKDTKDANDTWELLDSKFSEQ